MATPTSLISRLDELADFFTMWHQLHQSVRKTPAIEAVREHEECELNSKLVERHDVLSDEFLKPDTLTTQLRRFFATWQPLQTTSELEPPAPVINWDRWLDDMARFFCDIKPSLQTRAEQRRLGTAINVWKVSNLQQDELRNSKVLGWLLDCRGDHGQGARILSDLLYHIASDSRDFPTSATTALPYWTRIEACPLGEQDSRVDIEIDGEGLLLFIEVKIDAKETNDQLDRYLAIGEAKARGRPWGVIYLTRHGKLPLRFDRTLFNTPSTTRLISASWHDVVKVLERQVESLPNCFARSVFQQFAEHIQSFI